MSDIERALDVAADAAGYARNALRAQKATIDDQAAEIERLRATLAEHERRIMAIGAEAEATWVSAQADGLWEAYAIMRGAPTGAALDDAGAAGENGGEHG